MTDESPQSEIVLYQTEDGRTRIQCRFENETIWLTQKLMAELFQKDVRTINEHIQTILEDAELSGDSVIRKFRITAADGKKYETLHYNLEMILAVGYRVRSARGTQFRQWATARLTEYLVKGFTMDDERLKNPPGPGIPDCRMQVRCHVNKLTPKRNRNLKNSTSDAAKPSNCRQSRISFTIWKMSKRN